MPDYLLTSLKACDWSGHIFGASASPRSLTKKLAMSRSSTAHGRQHDTIYVAFELLVHATFVADEICGCVLEPARSLPALHQFCNSASESSNKSWYLTRSTWFDDMARGVFFLWINSMCPVRNACSTDCHHTIRCGAVRFFFDNPTVRCGADFFF